MSRIPSARRVREDTRAFVTWVSNWEGTRGAVLGACSIGRFKQKSGWQRRSKHPNRGRGPARRFHPSNGILGQDVFEHLTVVRAVRLGLVSVVATASARSRHVDWGFDATKRSAIRLRLTELGRATLATWALQNDEFATDTASA